MKNSWGGGVSICVRLFFCARAPLLDVNVFIDHYHIFHGGGFKWKTKNQNNFIGLRRSKDHVKTMKQIVKTAPFQARCREAPKRCPDSWCSSNTTKSTCPICVTHNITWPCAREGIPKITWREQHPSKVTRVLSKASTMDRSWPRYLYVES